MWLHLRHVGPDLEKCSVKSVSGECRKLHNEELSDLYSLPYIVRVVKSRRMRWAGYMARCGGGERCAQGSGGETGEKETIGETQT